MAEHSAESGAPRVYTEPHTRVRIRKSRRSYICATQREGLHPAPGDGWDGKPGCERTIRAGQEYVESTIYPGHDSGWAGYPHEPDAAPVTDRFCLPCSRRWVNLDRAMRVLTSATPPAATEEATR